MRVCAILSEKVCLSLPQAHKGGGDFRSRKQGRRCHQAPESSGVDLLEALHVKPLTMSVPAVTVSPLPLYLLSPWPLFPLRPHV